jgi:transcriptional regulator with XRE-family HTH domain
VQNVEGVFARSLRGLRSARKWSQARVAAEVAERRGLSLDPTAITRIEGGQRGVSLSEAVAIAAVLGATVDEMCTAGPGSTERELRRELAEAEAQLANTEAAMASMEYAYAESRQRVAELRARMEEIAKDDGAGQPLADHPRRSVSQVGPQSLDWPEEDPLADDSKIARTSDSIDWPEDSIGPTPPPADVRESS